MQKGNLKKSIEKRIASKEFSIGIFGLGYVGFPLALRLCEVGFNVTGFDIDKEKVKLINNGRTFESYS